MITLITGGPGTGKTAWLIDQLLVLRANEPNKEIFIHGIRNLRNFPHETIYCKSQLCDICRSVQIPDGSKYVENWPDWKTSGTLIIVDEVQRIWRPRTGAGAPPEGVSGLETHRHYGLDFWLISQGPHLFDNFIRLLVGRHIHLVSTWSGRTQYEWPECKQNVQLRTDAVKRPYRLPSRVFTMYDSAEVHTKQEKRKPLAYYGLLVAAFIALVGGVFVFYRMNQRFHPQQDKSTVSTDHAPALNSTAVGNVQGSSNPPMITVEQYQTALTPVVAGLPWSAPIYSELAKPVSMPVVVGCIKSNKKDDHRCACYTQQATIVDMPPDVCSLYVQHHAFNHFKPDTNRDTSSHDLYTADNRNNSSQANIH